MKPLLLVDHRDSFSGNLVALLASLGMRVRVVDDAELPSDDRRLNQLIHSSSGLVLSPGPGHPREYPRSELCYRLARDHVPILGVCLGLQIVLATEGAAIERIAQRPVHGRRESLELLAPSRFFGHLQSVTPWVFFNSLGCSAEDALFRDEWLCVAKTSGVAAWVEHVRLPILLTQFHPESFGSPMGAALVEKWLSHCVPGGQG